MCIRLLCVLCCCVLLFGCGTKLGKKAGFALDNKYLRIPDDNKLLMPPFLQDDLKSDQK